MPKDMIIPKGPYEVQRQNRVRIERQKQFYRRVNRRLYVPKQRMTNERLGKLIAYFALFYIVLATFTLCYMKIVSLILESKDGPFRPKTPGLMSVPGDVVNQCQHIVWRADFLSEIGPLRREIENFVKPYGMKGQQHLRSCNLDDHWGYVSNQPCIILKLNYSYNFTAVAYNDGITLPDAAPMSLYNFIIETAQEMRFNRIWVDCRFIEEQEDAYFDYIPNRYYDTDGTFLKNHSYLQFVSENMSEIEVHEDPSYRRLLGVQVINLPPNKDVHCQCVVWAKNIPLNVGTVDFMLHFIQVDKEPENMEDEEID